MMQIQIIRMNAEHILKIAEIEKECFSTPWSENALKEELTNKNACYFTALVDGEVAGYVGMYFVLDEGYITNVAVGKLFRKNHIADGLIKELDSYAQKTGLSFISLEVRKSNSAAIGLYSKNDYKIKGERKKFYRLPDEDAYIMTKLFCGRDVE